jgi:hypothetical protein
MDNTIKIALIGFVIGYLGFKFLNKKPVKQVDIYSDILSNEKTKVKGQWDR